MKQIQNFKFIFICICIICGSTLKAQNDSLLNYLDIAYKNNPLIQQKFNEYLAALEKVPQAGALQDPELSVGVFLTPMEVLGGRQVADIRLMQMFPWFGVLKNAKDEMSLMAKAKLEVLRDAKLQLYFEMQQIWIQMLKLQQEAVISKKNIEILKSIENISLVKYRASVSNANASTSTSTAPIPSAQSNSSSISGMGEMKSAPAGMPSGQSSSMQTGIMGSAGNSGLVELYRIQIEMGDLENALALNNDQQNNLKAKFNTYMSRPAAYDIWLPDSLKPDSLNVTYLLNSDSIKANNPMLGMIQYEQQSLDARKKMVAKMGFPMVGIGLNYSLINKNEMSSSSMNGEDMIMPMITVTLPIYRKKYKSIQKETDLLKKANEYAYRETSNSLVREYYDARQLFFDAERRIKLFEKQYLISNKSLDLVLKGFSVNSTGLNDVLRARQQTLDYELKKLEAIADYNLAQSQLKRLASF